MWVPMRDFRRPLVTCRQRVLREEGQNLVEFAFVTVLVLVLFFGITEFSRALWTWNSIAHATREGARYAVVEAPTSDDASIKNYVVYHDPNATTSSTPVVPGLSTSNVTISYFKYDGSTVTDKIAADVIQVSVSGYTFGFLVPFFGSGLTLPSFTTTLPLEGVGNS